MSNIAELVSELRTALHNADTNIADMAKNHEYIESASDIYNRILSSYGREALRPYLNDGDPLMRMQSAMAFWENEPETAIPVLIELNQNAVGVAATGAYMTLFELRRQGRLPAGTRL